MAAPAIALLSALALLAAAPAADAKGETPRVNSWMYGSWVTRSSSRAVAATIECIINSAFDRHWKETARLHG